MKISLHGVVSWLCAFRLWSSACSFRSVTVGISWQGCTMDVHVHFMAAWKQWLKGRGDAVVAPSIHLQVDILFLCVWQGRYLRYKFLLISVTSETQCELFVCSRLQCSVWARRQEPIYWNRKHDSCSRLCLEFCNILPLCGNFYVLKL